MSKLTNTAEWHALQQHYTGLKSTLLSDLMSQDPQRATQYSLKVAHLFVDYSKHRTNTETWRLLFDLARVSDVEQQRRALFSGELINFTEKRAVLHTALRADAQRVIKVSGQNVVPQVQAVLTRMRNFCDSVRNKTWQGATGKPISDIVNLGIGGSDLGPRMVVNALAPYCQKDLRFHFVANVDAAEIMQTLALCNPETTLFIVASKTFTTQETLINARTARQWFLAQIKDEKAIAKHFVAVSTNAKAVCDFGINPENMFEFWDWVGGRYSLWSAVGLSIMLAIGPAAHRELLAGARELDTHFEQAPLEQNVPVILALLGIWYGNFFNAATHGIFPYDFCLRDLPRYLQQADMESNGKRVTTENEIVDYNTGSVIWGETGVNGQHAYYQLLHQGTQLIPSDFIIPLQSHYPADKHHKVLLANYLAQMQALCAGKSEALVRADMVQQGVAADDIERLARHRSFPGNQPSTAIVIDKLTPRALGNLLALYEHKIFVQGVIWRINSFDQWGVELGKVLAGNILSQLDTGLDDQAQQDESTRNLIRLATFAQRSLAALKKPE